MMIIKDKIPMFISGYPTVSDKYDVMGGILEGDKEVEFGTLVAHGSATGYYVPATSAANVAGFVLGTNVKLASDWPNSGANVKPGEAFNLLLKGFIAVPLAKEATEGSIVANADVYVTTSGEVSTSGTELEGAVFTGMYEKHGDIIVAEVFVK